MLNDSTRMEPDDIYSKPSDSTYTATKTQVFIDWKPEMKVLRKLGLFAEDQTPVLCWFKNDPVIAVGSYIKLDTQYIPRSYDRDEFEIVDIMNRGIYDAVILNVYKLAPRRVKTQVGGGQNR
jgi:hypothetical protein